MLLGCASSHRESPQTSRSQHRRSGSNPCLWRCESVVLPAVPSCYPWMVIDTLVKVREHPSQRMQMVNVGSLITMPPRARVNFTLESMVGDLQKIIPVQWYFPWRIAQTKTPRFVLNCALRNIWYYWAATWIPLLLSFNYPNGWCIAASSNW